jgi:hypothetical protein
VWRRSSNMWPSHHVTTGAAPAPGTLSACIVPHTAPVSWLTPCTGGRVARGPGVSRGRRGAPWGRSAG